MVTSDAVPIVVPQMGVVEAVIVVEWLVADGARVEAGQPVVAVDTDKAVTELEAPTAGIVEVLVAASDDEVPVGTTLGRIVP